jgi:hypothetical protein
MKNIVLKFGLVSGGVSALLMLAAVPLIDWIGFDYGHVIGYTAMVISFLFVYFGIKAYRDNVLGGQITFGRAFGVGMLITVISCVCYVVAWQIVYQNFMPDFLDRYSEYYLGNLRASGASTAAVEQASAEMAQFKTMYANPFIRVAFTFIEPLPVGFLITLISAAVLRRTVNRPQ